MDLIDREKIRNELAEMYEAALEWESRASDEIIKARAESCLVTITEIKLRIERMTSAEDERKERIRQYKKMTSAAAMDAQGIEIGLVDTDD